jgi:hypothetical protein
MSSRTVHPPPAEPSSGPRRSTERYDDEGAGWVGFAAIMLLIVGVLNFIYGWAAIASANFFIDDARYVFSDLNTWGWILLCIGALQVIGAVALFAGSGFGRWIGILSAGLNGIAQLLFLPSYPLLSIALFAVDMAIIYGLVAYGHRRGPAL